MHVIILYNYQFCQTFTFYYIVTTPLFLGRETERRAEQADHHLVSPQPTDVSPVLPCAQLFLVLLFLITFPEPSAGHAS